MNATLFINSHLDLKHQIHFDRLHVEMTVSGEASKKYSLMFST